jgi:heme/copper-type cytochrome/quinol oxidase subunit 1
MLSESMGRLQFWLFFIGFNVAFFPIRLPDATALPGAWLIAASALLFAFNVFYAVRQGRPSGDNPWGAPDLLWATTSPPPAYNFEAVPVVDRREPLWPLDARLLALTGLSMIRREALLTSSTDAEPATRWSMPGPDTWPLWSAFALTVLFVWSIFSPWGLVWGSIPLAIALLARSWPRALQPSAEGAP